MVQLEMSSFAFKRYCAHRRKARFAGSLHDFMEDVVWRDGRKDAIVADLLSSDPGVERVVTCCPRTVEEVDLLRRQVWKCRATFLYANERIRYDRYCASGERRRRGFGYREFVFERSPRVRIGSGEGRKSVRR